MLSSEPNDEECDATTAHSSNAAGPIKSLTNIFNQIWQYKTIAIVYWAAKILIVNLNWLFLPVRTDIIK
jgi:hypothetical protein